MIRTFTLSVGLLFISILAVKAQCPITVDAGPDVYLCAPPTPTQLNGDINGPYMNFFWTPTTGMTGANTLTPTVSVTQTTNYVLTGRAADLSNNQIINGDFESGNSSFTSDYIYSPGNLWPEGVYDVIDNPQLDHPNFSPCPDHTSGTGNMLAVNGSGTPGLNVWCQTVPVMPNTQYVFSAWLTTLVASSPAQLQFSINGSVIGPIFTAPSQTCQWLNFFAVWNSGSNSSADICIVNQNTVQSGNDFALDDIVFAPTCLVTDTVTVHVVNVAAVAAPAVQYIPCDGASVTLNGTGSSTGPDITYNWETVGGNIVSGDNTLHPVVNAPGSYTLTVHFEKDGFVCEKTATVNVLLSPNQLLTWITPPSPLGCGSSTTTLIGNTNQAAFATYQWSTSDGNIVSGATAKNCVVNEPGTYTLLVTNTATGCTATAEVTVTVANNPPTSMVSSTGTVTCTQTAVPLSGSGSTTGAGILYSWTTPNGLILSGQNSINAIAGAGGTYILAVTNTSNNCTAFDSLVVPANTTLPTIALQAPAVLDCDTDTVTVSGQVNPANSALVWTFSAGGNIVSGQNTNAIQVTTAAVYTLKATNPVNGCTATASVTVTVNRTPPVAIVQQPDSITCQSPSIVLSGSGSSTGPNISYLWQAGPGGNIVAGNTTLSPEVNAAAQYHLIVTNAVNACKDTASLTVVADTNVVVAIANAPDSLTCTVSLVQIDANGSSTGSSITYLWTTTNGVIESGATTAMPTVSSPGTYQLLLTNTANGCAATDLAIVELDTITPQVNIAPPVLLTCANPSQVLTAQNLSAPGSYAYSWSATNGGNILSGGNTLSINVNAPGIYTLLVRNLNTGCSTTASVTVDQEAGVPTVIIAPVDTLTCTDASYSLNTNGSSTGSNFIYQWTTSGTGHIISGDQTGSPVIDAPGTYQLLITNNSNGCTATASVAVTQDTIRPQLLAQNPATLTCSLPAQQLQVQNLSLPGNFGYQWSLAGSGNIVSGGTTLTPLISAGGLYRLLVTNNSNGCTSTLLISVPADISLPAVVANTQVSLTCVTNQVPLNMNNLSLPGNFSYTWTTSNGGNIVSGDTTLTPSVNSPGTYTVVVQNLNNGCSSSATAVIPIDTAAPVIQIATPGTITCANPQFNLSAQNLSLPGNFTYNWSASSGGTIVGAANGLNPLVNTGGNYNLLVANTNNGCTSSLGVTVPQNTQIPQVDAGPTDTLSCAVSSLVITGTASGNGPLTYNWVAGNGGNILSNGNTLSPTINAAGNYSFTVTNTANGCTASDNVQILNDLNAPVANAGTAPKLTCNTTQLNLNGSGSTGSTISYTWTTSGTGHIVSGGNTLTPTINAPGAYQLAVFNSSNGCTSLSVINIAQDTAAPIVDAGAATALTCTTTSITLSGSGAAGNNGTLTYSWSGPGVTSGGNTTTPVVNKSGVYNLLVTNTLTGCTATDAVTVPIDTIHPTISIAVPQVLTCVTTSAPLNGSVSQPASNFNASWSTTNGHFTSGQNTLTPTIDKPGAYLLSVTNQLNGCNTTAPVTVTQDIAPPTAQAGPAGTITCSNPTISLDGTGSSSGVGFTYAWTASNGGHLSAGANTLTPLVDQPGTYQVVVTRISNGCTASSTTSVTPNTTAPTISIASPQLLTCLVTATTLSGSVSQPASNFSSNWTTATGHLVSGQNGLTPTVDQPGVYVLTVTNLQNGCSSTTSSAVSQNITPPGAEAGPAGVLNCKVPSLALQGSSPNTGVMAYAWSTSNGHFISATNIASPQIDQPGTYQLTVTNPANGCTSTDVVQTTEIPDPTFDPTSDQPDCLNKKGSIDFGSITGGLAPYRFSINGGLSYQSSPSFPNLAPGQYDLVVADANGCTDSDDITLVAPLLPTITLPGFLLVELGDSVQIVPELNIPPATVVSWQWTPGDYLSCDDCPSPWAKPEKFGNYTLTIEDKNGCTATGKLQLRVDKHRHIYAPNIFSPNDDGENDRFTLYGKGVKDVKVLRIYDRWGSQLFLTEHMPLNDESIGWDGTSRGQPVNPGVFVWVAVIEFLDGETEVLSGDVTVMR